MRAPGPAAMLALARLIGRAGHPGNGIAALDRVSAGRELHELIDQLTDQAVADALSAGARFEDVGAALGLPRSTAHRRYGHLTRA